MKPQVCLAVALSALTAAAATDYNKVNPAEPLKHDPGKAGQARLSLAKAGCAPLREASVAALYFQYGPYLLMGSSRPGGLPAKLQMNCRPEHLAGERVHRPGWKGSQPFHGLLDGKLKQ